MSRREEIERAYEKALEDMEMYEEVEVCGEMELTSIEMGYIGELLYRELAKLRDMRRQGHDNDVVNDEMDFIAELINKISGVC